MSEVRIELGFTGGGRATVAADESQWEQLQAACTSGSGGWVTISTREDETFVVDTSKVVFASVAVVSRSIGFNS